MNDDDPAAAAPDPAEGLTLQCRHVWKLFGARADEALRDLGDGATAEAIVARGLVPAVRDVNLSVRRGEIFVIMGLSGSGKSTLVRLMSRLIEPTAGEILFNGQNLLTASDKEMVEMRRHKMGMVFQHFALLPHLSVLGNVAFPLEVQGVARAEREARARKMIALVGLAGREEALPRQLSGGQQQRVGIARSLAVEPELWFLDEPFSALDPLIRREMQDEFIRLQSVLKKTIVFITHDFDEAIRLADRIAIMKDGEIVQQGTPEELVLNPATDYVREFTQAVPKARSCGRKASWSRPKALPRRPWAPAPLSPMPRPVSGRGRGGRRHRCGRGRGRPSAPRRCHAPVDGG
ncbi:MAG: glycine betaine/L-proline ABC transporter ATP-binding protein [Defluviimonas denitrificans]